MISNFEEWTAEFVDLADLDDLSGCTIAIEAAEYLRQKLSTPPTKEPLLPALGGLPFTLKVAVQNDIENWKRFKITPVFIFSGLDVGKKDASFDASDKALQINAEAWQSYGQNDAEGAVKTFGSSGSVKPEDLFRHLQLILRDKHVDFQVAPYCAWAQIAYLLNNRVVDAVFGASELLLFDVDQIITKWDFDAGEVTSVARRACLSDLGNISPDMFVDACMLGGNAFIPTLPQLNGARKPNKLKGAVDMMMNHGRSGYSVCLAYQDDPKFQALKYLDRFRKTRLAVKHHVVLTIDGKVEPYDAANLPGDAHEFLGQQLPEELIFYLSKGVIGPKILNWRTSAELLVEPPLDNGDSEEFRRLVRDQLDAMRNPAISLLSHSLHRFYQHADVSIRFWFDRTNTKKIAMSDLPDVRPKIANWNVKMDAIQQRATKLGSSGMTTLSFAVRSLSDVDFAKKTVTAKDVNKPLKTKEEVMCNALWRLLQLRGFVDEQHLLTPWGKVLLAIMDKLESLPNPAPELKSRREEAAFIAVELARLNLLSGRMMFPGYGGAPSRGSDEDNKRNLLVSRIACLLTLRHESIGFTGPLSRDLLGFHSMICAVRGALRDLVEVILTTMFLNYDASRERDDWTNLGLDLPFLLNNDCGLGIAVKSYLDEMCAAPEGMDAEKKKLVYGKGTKEWFPFSVGFEEDIGGAFTFVDAILDGIKASGTLVKDRAGFEDAYKWLSGFR